MNQSEHRTMMFVLGVLYSMKKEWKGIGSSELFEDILTNRRGVNLHIAWLRLKKEGMLGEFSDEFYFDTYHGDSSLTHILSVAVVHYHLVRLGGSDLCYHLDAVSPEVMNKFLRDEQIEIETIQVITYFLNRLLDKQAATAQVLNI